MIIYNKLLNLILKNKKQLVLYVKKEVKNTDKVLKSNFDNKTLKNWNKNKKNLSVTFNSPFRKEQGLYSFYKNTIYLKEKKSIFHELLHVASTIVKRNEIRSGFVYYNDYAFLNIGLNEGYTDLLTERYFNKIDEEYLIEKNISSLLEKIIGKKEMEKLYFNADINGLINHLQKYDNIKNITEFICTLDKIHQESYSVITPETILKISSKLFIWFNNKMKKELENKNIDENTYLCITNQFLLEVEDFEDEAKYVIEKSKQKHK